MDILTILLYSAYVVIGIASLVYFFKACTAIIEIRDMKKQENESFTGRFNLYLATGEKEKAKELLLRKIEQHVSFIEAFTSSGQSYTESERNKIRTKFKRYCEALGMELDFEKVDNLLQPK